MRKILLMALSCLMGVAAMQAVPACPIASKMLQPDGSSVTLKLHGDEYSHYSTTDDDYTVVKNAAGYYVYGQLQGGEVVPSAVVARDAAQRTVAERQFLSTVAKQVQSATAAGAARAARMKANSMNAGALKSFDYSKFRGLIILVQFNDKEFSYSNANEVFSQMANTKNFTGFVDENGKQQSYTGSVRDYYYDNSLGQFDPHFDVVGPVTINRSVYYPQGSANAYALTREALAAANPLVDFSQYDTDGDKEVDMVYFIFAGLGANFQGNNSNLIWPHKSRTYYYADGVTVGTYACSTELYGVEDSNQIDGIGTICHEFGHVLGLPDLYDTDYAGSGGQSVHPGVWSVMAGGSYQNNARTPVGYMLYERYALGFTTPQLIDENNSYSLDAINKSGTGYRINSSVDKEFFLLENRQRTGWDAYLPGHGMLVTRVDSTDVSAWTQNNVNDNPDHNYFLLLRAGNGTDDSGSDPFPGTSGAMMLNSATAPNLNSWTGTKTPYALSEITETDGVVTFNVGAETIKSLVEDFEDMDVTTANATDLQGKFSKWNLTSATVSEATTGVNGAKGVAMKKPSSIQTIDPVNVKTSMVSFTLYNPSSVDAKFTLSYSTDDGATWLSAKNALGETTVVAGMLGKTTLQFLLNVEKAAIFRVNQTAGSATKKCYLDDFTVYYDEAITSAVEAVGNDADASFSIVKNGNELTVVCPQADGMVDVYAVNGQLVARAAVADGKAVLTLPGAGFYVVRQGSRAQKIIM